MKFNSGIKVFAPLVVSKFLCNLETFTFPLNEVGIQLSVKPAPADQKELIEVKASKPFWHYAAFIKEVAAAFLTKLDKSESPICFDFKLIGTTDFDFCIMESALVATVFSMNEYFRRPYERRDLIPIMQECALPYPLNRTALNACLLGGLSFNADSTYLNHQRLFVPPAFRFYAFLDTNAFSPQTYTIEQVATASASFVHATYRTDFGLLFQGFPKHAVNAVFPEFAICAWTDFDLNYTGVFLNNTTDFSFLQKEIFPNSLFFEGTINQEGCFLC